MWLCVESDRGWHGNVFLNCFSTSLTIIVVVVVVVTEFLIECRSHHSTARLGASEIPGLYPPMTGSQAWLPWPLWGAGDMNSDSQASTLSMTRLSEPAPQTLAHLLAFEVFFSVIDLCRNSYFQLDKKLINTEVHLIWIEMLKSFANLHGIRNSVQV